MKDGTHAHPLLNPALCGVYRTPAHVEAVRHAVTSDALWVEVDASRVRSKSDLLDAFAAVLGFPCGFGRNWDALADSLSDRSTGAPEVVLWTGLRHLLEHDHDTVDVALQIFAEDTTNSGQLRVLIAETETPDLLSSLPVL